MLLLIAILNAAFVIGIASATDAAIEARNADADAGGWSWTRILGSRAPIVANGNRWPPPADEAADDCLVLVTRNQLMWHCPPGNATHPYERHVIHRGAPGRYRGAFQGLGSDDAAGRGRRLWLLHSPQGADDQLREVDTVTGSVLQTLEVDGCADGHDAVRVGDRAFLVDTRHGDVIEIAVPPAAEPFAAASLAAGAAPLARAGHVNIVKRHTGFTRADHINNVAIHPELLVSNLHGKGAIKAKVVKASGDSPTRLSALRRDLPEEEGRELTLAEDGFATVNNVGTWCHGIAFWEDEEKQQIELISLDSKEGALVSVALTGPHPGRRAVLWSPEGRDHPVLEPPEGIARAYHSGAKQFSKGLAVQGGVAYFGVSYARAPPLRQTVPESLLVAVDLATRTQVWARTVRSNGIINQILTRSSLGDLRLPAELSSVDLTQHGGGGKLVDDCVDREDPAAEPGLCRVAAAAGMSEEEAWRATCGRPGARQKCCVCRGGERKRIPHLAGRLDAEIVRVDEDVAVTATFVPRGNCRDRDERPWRIPLERKIGAGLAGINNIYQDLDGVVKHLCNLDVAPLRERAAALGDAGFARDFQRDRGNAVVETGAATLLPPGGTAIQLVYCSESADTVYHFPWLDNWLPMLQELVLGPLGIPLNRILRLQLANVSSGSKSEFRADEGPWVRAAHRTHVPLVTHADAFFLAEIEGPSRHENPAVLRIRADAGEAFEVNNGLRHAMHNLGTSIVHLVVDHAEEPLYDEGDAVAAGLVKLRPGEVCTQNQDSPNLVCTGFDSETGEREEL